MTTTTFVSAGHSYDVTTYGTPFGGESISLIILVHGNFGLTSPFGEQIHGFAKDLSDLGYLTAVPKFYPDDNPHPFDTTPFVHTLADSVTALTAGAGAGSGSLGLVGFSLGATTAMSFIAANPVGTVRVLADFFGFLTPAIRAGVRRFPPTIILHNKNDQIVNVQNSVDLDALLPGSTEHVLVAPYDEHWQLVNHAFRPGGPADVDSRARATDWLTKHLPLPGRRATDR